MSALDALFNKAERGTERATAWNNYKTGEKPMLSGLVETVKMLTPGQGNIQEAVWLIEVRDRFDGVLYSKFVSEASLRAQLLGVDGKEKEDAASLDPTTFPVQEGDAVVIRYLGEKPSDRYPGKKVTQWAVNIIGRAELEAAAGETSSAEPDSSESAAEDDSIPF